MEPPKTRDRRKSVRVVFSALSVVTLSAFAAGCTDQAAPSSPPLQSQANQPASAPTEPLNVTEAGLTVSVPHGCRIEDAVSTQKGARTSGCSGLRRLKLARVSPVEDLIRPGIHRGRDGWVGLRVVDDSYVYAVAGKREVLRTVLASAEATRPRAPSSAA